MRRSLWATKAIPKSDYEGRHLITDEVVEQMKVSLPLLQNGITAISFYVRELEAACKVQSTHTVLAPLLAGLSRRNSLRRKSLRWSIRGSQAVLQTKTFASISAPCFIPLIRARTVRTEKRRTAWRTRFAAPLETLSGNALRAAAG